MTAVAWKSSVTGDWSGKTNWTGGKVPGAADDVTVGVAGTYTVTIDGDQSAHSPTINRASATVSDTGTLTLGTTLAVTAGTFALNSGTVEGGTLQVATAASFVVVGQGANVLDGVTLDGAVTVGYFGNLSIHDGITLAGTNGTGSGTINVTGYSSELDIYGSATLDHATLTIGASGGFSYLTLNDLPGTPATLTLGSALSLTAAGYTYVRAESTDQSLVNNGTITAGVSSAYLYIQGFGQVTNNGVISV
jgi:hypothetical protein